jgi:large subunit ribosomal protein L7/L12
MSEASAREWSTEIKDIGDKIMALTLLKAQELGDYLKDVYGIEAAAAPVIAAGPALAGPAAGPAAAVEKDEFNVVLTGSGDKKIQVIKVVRELTGLGLKEAKDLVDGAPKVVKEAVAKAQAEEMKKKIEEAGGTVELK